MFTSASHVQSILSWDFFLQRFSSLLIESQIINETNTVTDISDGLPNQNNKAHQRKILIAKFACKKSNIIQTIRHELSGFSKMSIKQSKVFLFINILK